MDDIFTGAATIILAVVFLALGFSLCASGIASDCNKLGSFSVKDKVYDCKERSK